MAFPNTPSRYRETRYIIPIISILGGYFAFAGLFTGYFIEAIVAFLSLYMILLLFFADRLYTGLLFSALFQWFQCNIITLISNISLSDYKRVLWYPDNYTRATIFSNIIIICFFVGIKITLQKNDFDWTSFCEEITRVQPKAIILLIIFVPLLIAFFPLRRSFFAILSVVNSFSSIALLWFLFLFVTYKPKYKHWYYTYLTYLVTIGFLGFFANFRQYLLYAFIFWFALNKITHQIILPIIIYGILIIFLALQWTAVKAEYRYYLNGGTRQQVVLTSKGDNLQMIISLLSKPKINGEVFDSLVYRLNYVDFCSGAMEFVPNKHPHENGKLLMHALVNPFIPRFLFPGKHVQNDSDDVNKYTRLHVATAEQGVSFSLGYQTYFYIDFGYLLAIPVALILGSLIGIGCAFVCSTTNSHIFKFTIILCLFNYVAMLEQSLPKLTGIIVIYYCVILLIIMFIRLFIRNDNNNIFTNLLLVRNKLTSWFKS